MYCRDIQRRLSAYLDGELPPAMRDAFFDHLQECASCCDALGEAAFQETIVATVMKVPMKAPSAVRHNVMSAISAQTRQPVPTTLWNRLALRPAAMMTAVLALAGAGWRVYTGQSPQPPITVADRPDAPTRIALEPRPVAPLPKPTVRTARPVAPAPTVPSVKPAPANEKPRTRPAVTPAPAHRERPTPLKPAPVITEPSVALEEPPRETLAAVGIVTRLTGTLQTKRASAHDWEKYDPTLMADVRVGVRDHLRSTEDTVATLELVDGTVIKSNVSTEFVVLRSPTRSEPRWVVQLVRGELWVSAGNPVKIVAPGLDVQSEGGEFSVRSWDAAETSVLTVSGSALCTNPSGKVSLEANEATMASAGGAPDQPFQVQDPRGQLGWAYVPLAPFNPLDSGGTQA